MKTVLIVDDEVEVARALRRRLEQGPVHLVGGLLERKAGRLSLTMQVGGEQRLTVEVPLDAADGVATEATPC